MKSNVSLQRRVSGGLAVCIASLCFLPSAWGAVGVTARFQDPRPIIIGHRGCWRTTPENSLSGLNACVEHGIDMVELDVRETKDGQLVLMHDSTVDRTTNLKGKVEDFSLAEFKALYLRQSAGGKDAALTHESPPTFAEELRAAKGRVILYMDVKVDSYKGPKMDAKADADFERIFGKVFRAIEKEGAQDWVVFPSAPGEQYQNLPVWAQQRAMLVVGECSETDGAECSETLSQALESVRVLRPMSVAVYFKNDAFLKGAAATAAALGIRLCAASVSFGPWDGGRIEKDPAPGAHQVWEQLLDLGFSGIVTNDALGLAEYMKSRSGRAGSNH